jgi:hypothetical protein
MRSLLQDTLTDDHDDQAAEAVTSGPSGKGKGKSKIPAGRDDDTHYFDSYAENGMSHKPVFGVDADGAL